MSWAMQTVAVYAESPVKTYGLAVEEGWALISGRCPPGRAEGLARALLDKRIAKAPLCGAQMEGGELRFTLVVPAADAGGAAAALAGGGLEIDEGQKAVCLIRLQGPHFGDRSGIAALVWEALGRAEARPLAMQGVTHSLVLALDAQKAFEVLKELSQDFCGPA